jgi:serine/threonine protein kinase
LERILSTSLLRSFTSKKTTEAHKIDSSALLESHDDTSSFDELAYVEEYLSTSVSVLDRKKLDSIQQFNKMDLIVGKHLGKGTFSDVFEVSATVVKEVIPTLESLSSDRADMDKLIDAKFPSQNGREPEKYLVSQSNDLDMDFCVSDVDDLCKEAEEADIEEQINALFDSTVPEGTQLVIREDLSEKPNQDKVKEASEEFFPERVLPRSRSRRVTDVGGSICLGSLRRPSDHNRQERKMILAMKCLRPQIRSNADQFQVAIEDLVHETAMLASIDHPNIIKIHGRAGGRESNSLRLGDDFFILLDRLTETLEERMHRWKNLSYDKRAPSPSQVKTACSIADAISYLHAKRIVFRDLKPANVGFDSTGVLKLFDFGFAVGLNDTPTGCQSTDHGESWDGEESHLLYDRCGTLRYMAPEVGLELGYGLSADVYSFGILLWAICSLKKPFCHVRSAADLHRTVFEKNGRPKSHKHCPQVLRDLMTSCWSSSPNERPAMWYVKKMLSAYAREGSIPKSNSKVNLRGSFTSLRSGFHSVVELKSIGGKTLLPPKPVLSMGELCSSERRSSKDEPSPSAQATEVSVNSEFLGTIDQSDDDDDDEDNFF